MQGRTPNNNRHYIRPYVIGAVAFFFVVFGFIEVLALLEPNFRPRFTFLPTSDNWIALIGAILSYVGTCFIGIIAMWQNKQLSGINEKLMKIEEVKLTPRFNCKPGQPILSPGKTSFCLILEHIGGATAIDVRITDLAVYIGNTMLVPTSFGPFPDHFCEGASWRYHFDCNYVLRYDEEAYATFTLSFSDILGKSYMEFYPITWKSQSSFHHKDQNSAEEVLVGASNNVPSPS